MVVGEERENGSDPLDHLVCSGGRQLPSSSGDCAGERRARDSGLWRRLVPLIVCGVSCATVFAADKPRHAPPAKAAGEYVASDTHEKEHVAVGVEPCDDPKACPFFRLPYIQHGFLPIRVVITNNGEKALSLDDVRIQFISANHDVLPAATPEDINRRLFSKRSAEGTRIPGLPVPLTIHHAPIDKQVTEDDDDFGFPGTVVNAHSSLSGYLFYDVRELDDPVMKDAEVYLKMIHTLDGKEQMFAFSIPLNKWLDAQTKSAAAKPGATKETPNGGSDK